MNADRIFFRGASFEIKLEDPEADLTQVYVSSHLRTCWKEKTTRFSRLLTEFSEDQKEKVLDNFKLLDQSKSGQSLSCGTSVGHELSFNPLMLEKTGQPPF